MIFVDIFQCWEGHPDHIWRCQILMAAILDLFQRGSPMILCRNLNFPLGVCIVMLDLEMMFGDVLECLKSRIDDIWPSARVYLFVKMLCFLQNG